jgi:methylated-DNA-[protein]-cysteine S-methyltransferase
MVYHVMSAPGPLGLLFLASTERGVRYLEFLDKRSIKRAIDSHREENPDTEWQASLLDLKPVVDQLEAYFCGARTQFDLPLDPVGSEFEMEVWNELCAIPYGETRSYGQIAKAVGQPKGSRAVGLANNHNPIAIIVPCHRVIGADGSLTGYGGGLPRKRWLLAHETHFGALKGVTLDLFAGATSAQVNRVASGDGPPLSVARATPRPAPARRPVPAAPAAPMAKPGAKIAAAKPEVAKPARATKPATAKAPSAKITGRATARPAAAPAPARNGRKPVAKSASKGGTRTSGRAVARAGSSSRRTTR